MKILSGITNGQVLQRLGSAGATAKIEGTCDAVGTISATISQAGGPLKGWKKKAVGKAMRGKFSVVLKGIPAGGPYVLSLEMGKVGVKVDSFFVGDVWVLAGQSNMQGVGNISGAAKSHPLVRAFSMRREWRIGTEPLHVIPESPDICHNGGVQLTLEQAELQRKQAIKGTSVGIFFSREMLKRSGVPQGLICTAHGGTSMEQWDPERKKLRGESLYYSMLESVRATGQPVAGLLWYQGESDANLTAAPLYTARMQKLVAATRRDFGLPKMPWIIVQLARFFTAEVSGASWNSIQEQQRLLPGKIKHLETVAAIDLPMDDQIHVGAVGFVKLGQRMARIADRMVYGNKKEKGQPRLLKIRQVAIKQEGQVNLANQLEVSYSDVVGPLKSDGEPSGFVLVNSAGASMPLFYETSLHGNTVRLSVNGSIPDESSLSYGYGYVPRCNITDARGFALPVFGPCSINRSPAKGFLPFVNQWKVTGIIPAPMPLDQISCPNIDSFGATLKAYGLSGFSFGLDGFINEHPTWDKQRGQAYFQAKLKLDEPMKLQFLMGYDGPFKLWLNGESFFTDMKGINPCIADKGQKTVELGKGTHDVRVGMDLANGHSWGFFLRFKRLDVSPAKRRSGNFAKPGYLV